MSNPLLSLDLHPTEQGQAAVLPFDRIQAQHAVPAITELIARSKAAVDEIGAAPRTYAATLGAYEDATRMLDVAMTLVSHLEGVVNSPALREAHQEAQMLASAFYATLPLNAEIYGAISEFGETDEAKSLAPIKKRLLEKTLDAFRRNGAALQPKAKARMEKLAVELSRVTTKFRANVLDETNDFQIVITDETQLTGLPEGMRKAARQAAEAKELEGWRFTLQGPSYLAVMLYLDDSSIRERMWRGYNTRATEGERDNRGLICEILKLRQEKAELLGYANFADFVLEDRMAKNGQTASTFVAELHEKTKAAFVAENEALQAFRVEQEGAQSAALSPWDVGYYAEKLRKQRFDFDDEQLRPYFSAPAAMKGLFEVAARLYGVDVRPYEAPGWHEDVQCYGIYDSQEGQASLVATFYVDLFPRETKRGGAWMNGLLYGDRAGDQPEPHIGLFCANVTPPVGDDPALLTHREVETLFHEFGHLLHHALSDVSVRGLGGTNVAWDFVELPSQIMENFCWERESLDLFARHYQTNETIPDALFSKMVAARTFRAANAQMRQLGFATMDLKLHREFNIAEATPESMFAFARAVLAEHASTPLPENYGMVCAFGHLFGSPTGYAAAYYSYKWAEVLDADAFTYFKERGVLSAEAGEHFRRTLLSKGNSEEPDVLFRAFMGRDPNQGALLERSGLA